VANRGFGLLVSTYDQNSTPGERRRTGWLASFAAQIALEVDRVALRGTESSPEPRGVLNQSGVTLTAHGANGTAIANYDWWLDAVGTVATADMSPTPISRRRGRTRRSPS
jgi:hypothetical protein